MTISAPVIEWVTDYQEYQTYFNSSRQECYLPSEEETLYIIVRHCESKANAKKIFGGRTIDSNLTKRGIKQAKKTGDYIKFKSPNIDYIITSPLKRTKETAHHILASFYNESELDQFHTSVNEEIMERYAGIYEGEPIEFYLPTAEKQKEFFSNPEFSFEEKMSYTPDEEIESFGSVWERAKTIFNKQELDNLDGKVVLVVTHSGVMRSLFWHLAYKKGFFIPHRNFKPTNGSILFVLSNKNALELLETHNIKIINE